MARSMKVLLIHEHGRSFGSGGLIAMYRLHQSLREAGIHSTIACRKRSLETPDIVELPRSGFLEDWLGKITWRLGLNDIHCVSSFKVSKFDPFLQADVINMHGLHSNFFSYLSLPRLSRLKPIVLTMHDMWNITGHCAQSYECERWKSGCGKCPHLNAFPPVNRDATALDWKLKNWAYRKSNLTIVVPSRWLMSMLKQSMLARFPVHLIPNAVDTSVFRPLDRYASRRALGVPQERFVLMFASAALNDPMKGGPLLLEALRALPAAIKSKLTLLLLGDRGEDMSQAAGIPVVGLGYVREDERKALAYSAADAFVLPSRAENHSLVLLEAMSCGAPCLAFDVGGNGEIIDHLQTGYLAKRDSADDLRAGLIRLVEDQAFRTSASQHSRSKAEREFPITLHTKRYIHLYSELAGAKHGFTTNAASDPMPRAALASVAQSVG